MPDVVCLEDLDPFGRDLDDPEEELWQDVLHMLLESDGTNVDAPDRSIGLDDMLSGKADPNLRHFIESKLTDDDRIAAATATLSATGDNSVQIDLAITTNDKVLNRTFIRDADGTVTAVAA